MKNAERADVRCDVISSGGRPTVSSSGVGVCFMRRLSYVVNGGGLGSAQR